MEHPLALAELVERAVVVAAEKRAEKEDMDPVARLFSQN
jgi:hypothetical protein